MNKVAISSKPRLFCRRTAHWIIIQGGEKKVVHIMQTVDTCMQYWRQKIMKIRGQSLSSRFFSLIILITDCPPIQCHRTLANLDPAALFWRNSLWLWIAVEWVCTCVLAEAEDSGDVVFLKYTSMKKYTSEHYTSMQVCASTQMHQEQACANTQVNTQVCRGAVPLTGQAQLLLPCHRETIFLLDQQPLRVTITS